MSFTEAINYPFRNNNMLKILPLAIVYSIVAFVSNYFTSNPDLAILACGGSLALLIFSLVLSGYYVSTVEGVQHGYDTLPQVNVSSDLRRGVMMVFAGIVYFLPMIIFACIAGYLMVSISASSYSSSASSYDGSGMLLFCGVGLIMIPVGTLLSWAMYIGVNRYAYEGNGLFSFAENFGMAWSNIGLGIGLLARQFLLGLLNFIVVVIFFMAVGMVTTVVAPNAFVYGQVSTAYWIYTALVNVVSYTITLVFMISQYHLIAQYGIALGFSGDEKRKNDMAAGGSGNVLIIVLAVIGLLVLIGFVVMIVLVILGPTIGNVFSNIITTLEAPAR